MVSFAAVVALARRRTGTTSKSVTVRRVVEANHLSFSLFENKPMNHCIITRPFVPVTLPSVLTGDAAAQRDGQATWAASETAISIIDASH
jgi:hypothetical protein